MKFTRKKIIKITLYTVLTPIGFVVLYLGMAYLLSYLPASQKEFKGDKHTTVYVHTNGVHLDIAVSKQLLDANLVRQLKDSDKADYLSFGWGDKGFYLETPEWSDLKTSVAIRAMLMESATAMHVTRYNSIQNDWKKVVIGAEQLRILNEHIKEGFTQKNGSIIEIENSGYYANDHFYEANGSYHLFRTCNIWVNEALQKAGVKTSMWSPFDFGVLHHLEDL